MKGEYMRIEFLGAKHYIKTVDIRELYLIRALPQARGDSLKQLSILQQNIAKVIRDVNYYILTFGQIKDKLKEAVEAQNQAYQNILKGNHLDALYQLGLGAIEYVKWSQENAIRSYEAHEPFRMDMWMDEVTIKVFSFLEHLISQMDIGEVINKKKIRSYKKIPTQIALRSLKSMAIIGQNDVQIQNLNKIILEEENKGKGFGDNDQNQLQMEDLPSLANRRNLSFQFQRSPVSGKYSPFNTKQLIKSLTPGNQDRKNYKQKSSVLDAFHTFININESNNSTPNANASMPDFQTSSMVSNMKSHFFSNQNQLQKSTFNYIEESNNLYTEENNQKTEGSIELNLKQEEGQLKKKSDNFDEEIASKKGILLKKASIENHQHQQAKKKVNVTSFDHIDNEDSYRNKRKSQAQNNNNNAPSSFRNNTHSSLIDKDEEEQRTMSKVSSSNMKSIKNKSQIKYSLDDLQRIDQDLKQKKAKLREENKVREQIAKDELMKAKDMNNMVLQNQIVRQKYNNHTNLQISINLSSKEGVSQNIQRALSSSQLFANEHSRQQKINSTHSSQTNLQQIQANNQQNESINNQQSDSLKNTPLKPLNLEQQQLFNNKSDNINQKSVFLSPKHNGNLTATNADDRFLHIINYRQQNHPIDSNTQFNQIKPIYSTNMVENKYYLQNSSFKQQKKQPHLQMDFKNDIKIKSKFQIDEQQYQKFNSSLDGIEQKSIIENNRNSLNSKVLDLISVSQQQTFSLIKKASPLGKVKEQQRGNYNSQNIKTQGLKGEYESNDPLNLQNIKRNSNNQIHSEINFQNSPLKLNNQESRQTQNTEIDVQQNDQRVRLPSLPQHNSAQMIQDRSSFQISNSTQIRGESENRGQKMSILNPSLSHITPMKQPIDLSQIQYLKKKNRMQSESLKQILLANFANK